MVLALLFSLSLNAANPPPGIGAWVKETNISKANTGEPYPIWPTKAECVTKSAGEKCFDLWKCPPDECRVTGFFSKTLDRDGTMMEAKQARIEQELAIEAENKAHCDQMSGAAQRICDRLLEVKREP